MQFSINDTILFFPVRVSDKCFLNGHPPISYIVSIAMQMEQQ